MKKLIGILTLVLVFSLTANAQRQGQKRGMKSDFTPEQVAELQTKRIALQLDLTEAQQKKVFVLFKENAIERKAMRDEMLKLRINNETLDNAKRFELENERLEKQLSHKSEMKKILNDDQFEKWETLQLMRKKNNNDGRGRGSKNKGGNRC